jgi:hypothetical protein
MWTSLIVMFANGLRSVALSSLFGMFVQLGKLTLQRRKRFIQDRPDGSQRMIPSHPRLQVNVAEQLARSIAVAAHAPSTNLVGANQSCSPVDGEPLFQQLLKGDEGDRINAVLAAAGRNLSLLLRWFRV